MGTSPVMGRNLKSFIIAKSNIFDRVQKGTDYQRVTFVKFLCKSLHNVSLLISRNTALARSSFSGTCKSGDFMLSKRRFHEIKTME